MSEHVDQVEQRWLEAIRGARARLAAQLQILENQESGHAAFLAFKYQIKEGDRVTEDGEIRRAPPLPRASAETAPDAAIVPPTADPAPTSSFEASTEAPNQEVGSESDASSHDGPAETVRSRSIENAAESG